MRTSAFIAWLSLSFLAATSVRAETLPVWWADKLAPPGVDALEGAFEADLSAPIVLEGPRADRITVETCDDAADAANRNFKPVDPANRGEVQKCVAMAEVLFAAEASASTFRQPATQTKGRPVPGGAPRPLSIAHVELLPAMLAPFEGCGFGVLALRASDRFWSLLRFAHVYGAGNADDGRESDTLNGKGDKALMAKETTEGLTLKQNGVTVTLSLLALGDFDADGAEDALIQKSGVEKSGSEETARLYQVSQFRDGAVMRMRHLDESYHRLLGQCPDLVVDLARTSPLTDKGGNE